MDPDRFRTIVEAFGADPERWPEAERTAAQAFLASSPQAQQLLAAEQDLDALLDTVPAPAIADQSAGILARLPVAEPALIERLTDWLIPERMSFATFFRPALAAALPLLAGIYLGPMINLTDTETVNYWDEEVYLLTLEDSTEVQMP
ncbi:MAG: hypothetical protein KDI36_18705 [Pseudomonadales bacterium]|nr:hypothetical protein [Pseudomonadales bacterium]